MAAAKVTATAGNDEVALVRTEPDLGGRTLENYTVSSATPAGHKELKTTLKGNASRTSAKVWLTPRCSTHLTFGVRVVAKLPGVAKNTWQWIYKTRQVPTCRVLTARKRYQAGSLLGGTGAMAGGHPHGSGFPAGARIGMGTPAITR